MSQKILVINGPNLNLLGTREKEKYGQSSLEDIKKKCKSHADKLGLDIEFKQSNVEGELIDKIHSVGFSYDGIIINAGAYTHTSVALRDAIAGIESPVIEVHISNTHQREEFRHHSYISPVCKGIILGFGLDSYRLAIESFLK